MLHYTTAYSNGTPAMNGAIYFLTQQFCPVVTENRYKFNAVTNMCERTVPNDLTITLSPKSATIEPGKTYSFTATVTNQDGSAPSQPVPVSVKVEVDPTSGGHVHGDITRPKGNVSPTSGSTVLNFTFTAETASGTHTVTAMCDLCVNKTATATVNVKVDGLAPIPGGASFYTMNDTDGTVIGSTSDHKNNHYLIPDASTILLYIASSYHAEV